MSPQEALIVAVAQVAAPIYVDNRITMKDADAMLVAVKEALRLLGVAKAVLECAYHEPVAVTASGNARRHAPSASLPHGIGRLVQWQHQ